MNRYVDDVFCETCDALFHVEANEGETVECPECHTKYIVDSYGEKHEHLFLSME